MLRAIFADAMFCAALFAQSLALVSILQASSILHLPEEFIPVMNFYHVKTGFISWLSATFFAGRPPVWFADAVLIAAVLFFLFTIGQARSAMAPEGDDPQMSELDPDATRLDKAIDFFLPAFVCAVGAIVTAPTLLPFLTLPIAFWLLLKRLFGTPAWFRISPSYYVNAGLLGAITASILALFS